MRNSLATIFLAVLAGNAAAAWTVINEVNGITEYVDVTTIRHSANTIKMWTLRDYNQTQKLPSGADYSSSVTLYEFDCTEQRVRAMQVTAHEGHMQQGQQVFFAGDPWQWAYASPGTVGEIQLQIACKKRNAK